MKISNEELKLELLRLASAIPGPCREVAGSSFPLQERRSVDDIIKDAEKMYLFTTSDQCH